MAIFRKKEKGKGKFKEVTKKKGIPPGLWAKCKDCGKIIFKKALEENLKVCPKCDYHLALTSYERINLLLDEVSFKEINQNIIPADPLNFKGPTSYKDKLKTEQEKTNLFDAAVTGTGKIDNKEIAIGVTDSRFIMGSMGSVVGEKITRVIELAQRKNFPLIIVSGSGGGARMQEGMFSLMQMAKTAAAVSRFKEKGGLFISVLTHPTMAGVMASFASLGDILIAEPGALIGFTGPRVIKQTIHQDLPKGFQRAEFLLNHGLIDIVVHRKELRKTISSILNLLWG